MRINRGLIVLSAATILIGACGFSFADRANADRANLVAQDSTTPNNKPEGMRGRRGGGWANIPGLTDAQKQQIQQIHQSTRQQMDAVLTSEQREQIRTAREQRQRPNLNLSDDQKARMRTIREDAKRRMEAVLTPEQRQQLEQMRQQRQQRRQQSGQPQS